MLQYLLIVVAVVVEGGIKLSIKLIIITDKL